MSQPFLFDMNPGDAQDPKKQPASQKTAPQKMARKKVARKSKRPDAVDRRAEEGKTAKKRPPDEVEPPAKMDPKGNVKPAEPTVYSISELTERIKGTLEEPFRGTWIRGEVSELSRPRSGHIYLTIKDEGAQIRAVIWRTTMSRLQVDLNDGMQVIAQGNLEVYGPRGSYQLILQDVQPQGEGALQLKLKKLQKRLAEEGLFNKERKRELPTYPKRIAVITSPTGAAVRDFLEVLTRRWPMVEVLVVPALVQGPGASAQIARAIKAIARLKPRPDVAVVTRGGGSIEDLWAFNEEPVVRAVAQSQIPIVSAVGHEIDVTLCDLAADVRALTPSEAAELVVPAKEYLNNALYRWHERLHNTAKQRIRHLRQQIEATQRQFKMLHPQRRLQDMRQRVDEIQPRLDRAIARLIEQARSRAKVAAGRLESLSPLKVLGRGYSVTFKTTGDSHDVVTRANEVKPGETIRTQVASGEIISRVESTKGSETEKGVNDD